MTVDELTRRLLTKMIAARIDLVAYIQLRKAQGYMSVNDNDRLRDAFFALAQEIRDKGESVVDIVDADVREAVSRAEEALSSAAVCMMTGRHDCPTYIAVNVDKLERSQEVLHHCIRYLSAHSPLEEA